MPITYRRQRRTIHYTTTPRQFNAENGTRRRVIKRRADDEGIHWLARCITYMQCLVLNFSHRVFYLFYSSIDYYHIDVLIERTGRS